MEEYVQCFIAHDMKWPPGRIKECAIVFRKQCKMTLVHTDVI
jgi:hypothetical protein